MKLFSSGEEDKPTRRLDWSTMEIVSLDEIQRMNAAKARRREERIARETIAENRELEPAVPKPPVETPVQSSPTKKRTLSLDDLKKPEYKGPVNRHESASYARGVPAHLKVSGTTDAQERGSAYRQSELSWDARIRCLGFIGETYLAGLPSIVNETIGFIPSKIGHSIDQGFDSLGETIPTTLRVPMRPGSASWLGDGLRSAARRAFEATENYVNRLVSASTEMERATRDVSPAVILAGSVAFFRGDDPTGLTTHIPTSYQQDELEDFLPHRRRLGGKYVGLVQGSSSSIDPSGILERHH